MIHIPEEFTPTINTIYPWENDIIFDGFLGSGTTALACIDLKRKILYIF